jgi:hypothetical protein
MRALKAATIIMGVLILAGTAVLIATIVKRASAPAPVASAAAPFAVKLEEPAGTRITGVTAPGDLLALALAGGGPDRVVLLDPRSGRVAGRIAIAAP